MWEYDPIMRGWRYVIIRDGVEYRSWCAYAKMPIVKYSLRDALRWRDAGKPTEFTQTGDNQFTLAASL